MKQNNFDRLSIIDLIQDPKESDSLKTVIAKLAFQTAVSIVSGVLATLACLRLILF